MIIKKQFIVLVALSNFVLSSFSICSNESVVPASLSFYDLSVKSLDGKSVIHFKDFKGRKVLCVNTASQCGFTYQYTRLENLYRKYKDKLVIIGFPCNQFGGQESWSPVEIKEFCSMRYGVTFPLSEKINVKGDSTHIVYQWLTQKKFNKEKDVSIRWNFGKFLISEKGKFIEYFPSKTEPDDPAITSLIEK